MLVLHHTYLRLSEANDDLGAVGCVRDGPDAVRLFFARAFHVQPAVRGRETVSGDGGQLLHCLQSQVIELVTLAVRTPRVRHKRLQVPRLRRTGNTF